EKLSEIAQRIVFCLNAKKPVSKLKKLKKTQQNEEDKFLYTRKLMLKQQQDRLDASLNNYKSQLIKELPEISTVKLARECAKERSRLIGCFDVTNKAFDVELLMNLDFLVFKQQMELEHFLGPLVSSTAVQSEIK
ncbi:MAG: hypothetical protein MHPSP_004429, partial [Paramarteilia canceri]